MGNCCVQEEPADEYNGGLEDFDDFDPFGRYAPKFGTHRGIVDVSNCVVVDQSPTHVYAWHQHSGYRNYSTPPLSPPTFPRYGQSRPISIYEVGSVNYSKPNKWNDPLMDSRFATFSPSRETSPMIIDAVFRPPSPVQSPVPHTSPTYNPNASALRFRISQPPSRSASPEPAMYRASSWNAPRSRSPTPPPIPTPIPRSPVNKSPVHKSPVNRPPPLVIPTAVTPILSKPVQTSPKVINTPTLDLPQDSPPVPQTPPPQPYMLPPYEFTPSSPQPDELPSPSSYMSSPQHSAIMSKDARFEKLKEVQKVLQDSVQVIDRARTVLKTSEMIQAATEDDISDDDDHNDSPPEFHPNITTQITPPSPPSQKAANKDLENYINAPSEPEVSSNPFDVYIPYLPSTSSSPSLGKTLSTPDLTISPPSPRDPQES